MNCVICRNGDTSPGTTTVTLQRGSLTLIVRGVPAAICKTCGEAYVDQASATRLLQTAEQASKAGIQVEIREFAVA